MENFSLSLPLTSQNENVHLQVRENENQVKLVKVSNWEIKVKLQVPTSDGEILFFFAGKEKLQKFVKMFSFSVNRKKISFT